MSKTYTTIQGDMWDSIALKVYRSENCMSFLLEANQQYRDIAVFPAGVVLTCPELAPEQSQILPPWRR